jgi:hypothetical protein
MRMIVPGKAIPCFEQPDMRGYDFTNSWSNITDVVEADRPATELLKQAMNYPALDFYLEYSNGPETLVPHLVRLRRCALRLSTEAICDLHDGKTASATTNLCALFALINGEQNERLLYSQLVRITMTQIAVNPTWELLQSTNVKDADLAMLQRSWERLELIHAMENAFLMERARDESIIEEMRASNEYFDHIFGGLLRPSSGPLDFAAPIRLASYAGDRFMWRAS